MVTRVSGFTSGLDIDQIVQKLMSTQRAPLNKLTQQKVTLEWQREQYRDITSKMVDFRNNKLFNYGLAGSISAKQATITGNATAVTAKATSNAVAGSMTVEVTQLATAAMIRSGDAATDGIGKVDMTKTLKDLRTIITAPATSPQLSYTPDDAAGNVTFQINGKTITLNENTDTLATMVQKINSDSAVNATAFLDSETGKLSITSKATGAGAMTVSGGLMTNFDFSADPLISKAGVDANVKINGMAVTRKSNSFTENGVEITLNALSNGTATTINVNNSTDKIVETIKSYIADYNDLLSTVNGKINETRYRKFPPLTDEQRKDMKEDEIKLWESKAKSGLLRGDTALTALAGDMRLASITDVTIGTQSVNLTSFGISTGDWTQKGKLIIVDEAKLRAAIDKDPDTVVKFFTQQTTQTDPNLKKLPTTPDNGLFNRLSNVIMTGLESLAAKAGTSKYSADKNFEFLAESTIGGQLTSIDKRLDSANLRLNIIETRYYKQFTAMEKAMSRYSAQSSNLFGAMK